MYIGFGSIVVDDPNAMTTMIFEAVKKAGVRALVSKGWGGLGAEALGVPDGVFMLGNVPHDWLFKHVSCVVHHGGAGTTAAGIALGKPTVVVPFFGDQPFWGAMVARAGAGPEAIPYKQLTADKLATSIMEALQPSVLEKAQELGASISQEKGTDMGGKSFHDTLDVDNLRCTLAPSHVAVWRVKRTQIRLSALAATVLSNAGLLSFAELKLQVSKSRPDMSYTNNSRYRPREYETEDGPWDPISGGASALAGTISSLMMGVADVPVEIFKVFKSKSDGPSPKEKAPVQQSQADSKVSDSSSGLASPIESPLSPDINSPTVSSVDRGSEQTGPSSGLSSPMSDATSMHTRTSSMKQTLAGQPVGSRSTDRRPGSRSCSPAGLKKEVEPSQITLESAIGAGKGVSRIIEAGMKSPLDFTLSLARGFHNAPKLYGDDTVRPSEKVTDFQSGLKAAGKVGHPVLHVFFIY